MLKRILFLCVENRARSQMAEGLARQLIGHNFEVFSAGAKPADRVHPMAVAVMAEIGIDISSHKPKSLNDVELNTIDCVITLCGEDQCPVLPANIKVLHWGLQDPAATEPGAGTENQIKKFRKIRDELRRLIRDFSQSSQSFS